MNVFSTIRKAFVTTEHDLDQFIVDAWNEAPAAIQKARAVLGWIAKTGFPELQAMMDTALPFMNAVSASTGHPELVASLTALDAASHAVSAAINSAQAGSITVDQVTAVGGAYKNVKATFAAAMGHTAVAVAQAPYTGVIPPPTTGA